MYVEYMNIWINIALSRSYILPTSYVFIYLFRFFVYLYVTCIIIVSGTAVTMPPKKKAQKPSNKTEQKKKDKIIEVMYC